MLEVQNTKLSRVNEKQKKISLHISIYVEVIYAPQVTTMPEW